MLSCFFFFQAEDGIRDRNVTGVQTCALPIYYQKEIDERSIIDTYNFDLIRQTLQNNTIFSREELNKLDRSEERRVGKECRSRGSADHYKKKEESYKERARIKEINNSKMSSSI